MKCVIKSLSVVAGNVETWIAARVPVLVLVLVSFLTFGAMDDNQSCAAAPTRLPYSSARLARRLGVTWEP